MPAKRHRRFTARQQNHGTLEGAVAQGHFARDCGVDFADVARLSFDRVRQDDGRHSPCFGPSRGSLQRKPRRGDNLSLVARKDGIVRRRSRPVLALQPIDEPLGQFDSPGIHHCAGSSSVRRVGNRGSRRDLCRVIARDVGNDEADHFRRVAGGGEPPSLYA
jgi:hypothetical protein